MDDSVLVKVLEGLNALDGTVASSVSLLGGITAAELDALGGFSDREVPL